MARDRQTEWRRYKNRAYWWACLLRDGLRALLGGKCKQCGATELLEFHHPNGRDWEPRKKNLRQRMRLYWRDHLFRGGLELLCSPCNGRDGAGRGFWQRTKTRKRRSRGSSRKGR